MEHKNSFHIKKLNHQSGFGWAEMMRTGYVWLAALLCFIWYAADRFEMDTAGVALFIGAAFFILLYFVGISVGKGFTVFISGLYFFVPFFILSMENIRRALLIFSRTVFDYLADYGQSKNFSSYNSKYIGRYADRKCGVFSICCRNIGDNFVAYSFYGIVVESPALYFIFYRSDLLRFSIFCMGSPARIVCSVKLSHFLFLFLCSVFLGRYLELQFLLFCFF